MHLLRNIFILLSISTKLVSLQINNKPQIYIAPFMQDAAQCFTEQDKIHRNNDNEYKSNVLFWKQVLKTKSERVRSENHKSNETLTMIALKWNQIQSQIQIIL